MGKPEGKSSVGKTWRRWIDNIKMDLIVVGWDDMDWIDLIRIGISGGLL
jgi:hypothetical protein